MSIGTFTSIVIATAAILGIIINIGLLAYGYGRVTEKLDNIKYQVTGIDTRVINIEHNAVVTGERLSRLEGKIDK